MRWAAQWLEKKGLGRVADTLDKRAAGVGDVRAMHAIARRALRQGEAAEAVRQLERATKLAPDDDRLWCGLGAAYRHASDFEQARQAYERALALKADNPQVLSNLGEWCMARGENEAALRWFDKALQADPGLFEARLNKTAALFELARYAQARTLAEQLVADEPRRAEACLNLGNVLVHTGKSKQGIKLYKKALELQPGYVEAHYNLATLLGSRDDLAHTISYLERRLREQGESIQNLGMLAAAHQAAGHLSESEIICQRILERQPDNIAALVTLGSCLSSGGDSAAALAIYQRVVQLDGSQVAMASNVLFEYNNVSSPGRDEIFRQHLAWAERFETPLLQAPVFTDREHDPQRKLRIGYVSGDMTRHPVGFLLRDILQHHDGSRYAIHCYSMLIRPEEALPELRQAADVWEDVFYLDDDELVALIRQAQIDILVDLSGHTGFHRLPVFARRPAPVQVEWIGYFHSTGMRSIDYFITDPATSPPGSGQLFSEIPVYMPHSRFCYGAPAYAPEVVTPPVVRLGYITFGSFNRLPKMTEEVVATWSAILKAMPDSRLIVKSGALADTQACERLRARFERHGIARERLVLRENSLHAEMLAEYGDIDIALDTFPFNGGMTTLEALWMGVPVITVAGDTVVSRQTVAALENIGLAGELAFPDLPAYIDGALALARSPQRLAALRQQMRPCMAASPLRQPERFTRDLESLYRRMWRAWCKGERLPSDMAAERGPCSQGPCPRPLVQYGWIH
jgi:protein O-GlcNAc transferase